MDIYQLRTFAVVAREGSVTRAASVLCLSQPAVSAHIRSLEDMLELSLFERTVRGMQLTPEGKLMLQRAEAVLTAHQQLQEEAQLLHDQVSGQLRIGTSGDMASDTVVEMIKVLTEQFPRVDVTLRYSGTVAADIISGALDAGFFNEPGDSDPVLQTRTVMEFGIWLAAPAGWSASATDWPLLARQTWVCPAQSTCCGRVAETLFAQHGMAPEKIIRIDREKVCHSLIRDGVGIGLLHDDVAKAAAAAGEVDLLFLAQPSARLVFATVAQRQDALIRALHRCLDALI